MNANEGKRSNVLVLTAAIAVIVGFAIGFLVGNVKGKSDGAAAAEQRYSPIVDSLFPKPSAEIKDLSGTVKDIYGASIALEVYDPDDYLPHTDGSPRAKQIRTANVTGSTTYTIIDFGKLDREGNPARVNITFGDLKTGDTVTVHSNENIKSAQTFDITGVDLVRY
ncbi:MAG: hypothetical protein V1696_02050 [Candidatus Jorgensenbacteria bacterium]